MTILNVWFELVRGTVVIICLIPGLKGLFYGEYLTVITSFPLLIFAYGIWKLYYIAYQLLVAIICVILVFSVFAFFPIYGFTEHKEVTSQIIKLMALMTISLFVIIPIYLNQGNLK